ncbi:ABC transporter ATP-binding protein [Streptantibioticus silvisoli]|uniref:ABC transporter ATP-binding protein n=1 Tax=Streptantibioticus silvisoli TaxID=2705255 RepID=UPI003556778C
MRRPRATAPAAPAVPAKGPATGTPRTRPAAFGPSAARVLRRLVSFRRLITGIAALGLTSILLNVCGPRLLGHTTDLIFSGTLGGDRRRGIDYHAVTVTLAVTLAVYAVSGLCWILQGRLTTRVIQHAVSALRQEAGTKLSRLPLSYFDRQQRGEVLARVTNDVDNLSQSLQQTLSQVTNSLLLVLGIIVMMMWISPLLAVIALVTVPLALLGALAVGRRAQPQFARQWQSTGELSAYVEEMYSGHALVRSSGRGPDAVREFGERNRALLLAGFRAQFLSGLTQPVMSFVNNVDYVLIAVVGGLRVASGTLSIGEVQAFIQYAWQFSGPLSQLAALGNVMQSGVASAERIFEFLDAPEETPDPPASTAPPQPRGRVTLENVSFGYEPGRPLLRGIDLDVPAGRTVAVVGSTGAGKTTLVNLLMRFYEVTGGRILIDGADAAAMTRHALRSHFGTVPQDTWLFAGTVADNIAYGVSRLVTREEIEAASRAAAADHFIRTLPDSYDTVLADDGAGVSAGERQLLTIARAFLADPPILLLDEATSAVDTRTELLIQRATERLSAGRTTFVIAHRLSTIRKADLILVMDEGAVVERGTHAELLALGGLYARLHAAHAGRGTGTG